MFESRVKRNQRFSQRSNAEVWLLDAQLYETHRPFAKLISIFSVRSEDADLPDLMKSTFVVRDDQLIARPHPAVQNPHDEVNPRVLFEPGVEDIRSGRGLLAQSSGESVA